MKTNNVIIKSLPNGVSVHLQDDVPMEELLEEVVFKFRESARFFKKAKIALTFEGRSLSSEEEIAIIQAITSVCDMQIMCLVGKDDETNQILYKALRQLKFDKLEQTAQIIEGDLKNGASIELESNILLLGSVNPGCKITSSRNIIILGGLYGSAVAGTSGEEHFIFSLHSSPEYLQIGTVCDQTLYKQSKWPIKPKPSPKLVYAKDQKLITEEGKFTPELLSKFF